MALRWPSECRGRSISLAERPGPVPRPEPGRDQTEQAFAMAAESALLSVRPALARAPGPKPATQPPRRRRVRTNNLDRLINGNRSVGHGRKEAKPRGRTTPHDRGPRAPGDARGSPASCLGSRLGSASCCSFGGGIPSCHCRGRHSRGFSGAGCKRLPRGVNVILARERHLHHRSPRSLVERWPSLHQAPGEGAVISTSTSGTAHCEPGGTGAVPVWPLAALLLHLFTPLPLSPVLSFTTLLIGAVGYRHLPPSTGRVRRREAVEIVC